MCDNDLRQWLNNPHVGAGPEHDENDSGDDNDDGVESQYRHYDTVYQTSYTEASQSDEDDEEIDEVDEEIDEDDYDDRVDTDTHYSHASVLKRRALGLPDTGEAYCFLCAGQHLSTHCDTYEGARVRSLQCFCGLFHTEGYCQVSSSDSED